MTETETPSRLQIVDDTLATLRILTDMLRQQGYTVRGVRNGDMGLAVASSTRRGCDCGGCRPVEVPSDLRSQIYEGGHSCRRRSSASPGGAAQMTCAAN